VGQVDCYLKLPTGAPALDLMTMAREGLGTKLRGAVHKAVREGRPVDVVGVQIKHEGGPHRVAVRVVPVQAPKAAEGLLLVTFRDAPQDEPAPPVEPVTEDSLLRQLENELRATKEDLQSTIEELESSNEELKASNEEVMSMNEELQSANEELETSKEELQSLNEELSTVNNQLHEKVDQLEATNNDMANLLNCTEVATVFLDEQFRIRRFTPAATQLFSLIDGDVGRPIGDITRKFGDPDLLVDAERVLRQLAPREKQVRTEDGRWWFRRVVPYRTMDNRIHGVVITFGETTQVKAADMRALRERESRLSAILGTAADAIITIDGQGLIQSVNPAAERLFGYTASELVGQNVNVLMPSPYAEEHDDYIANYLKTGTKKIIGIGREVSAKRKDGSVFPVDLAVSEADELNMFTGVLRDISERKRLEREIVEIANLEQRRLGADLHDECGQELSALGLLAASLVDALHAQEHGEVKIAAKIDDGLKRMLRYVHNVARGLSKAEIEPAQLPAALEDLASRLTDISGTHCEFHGAETTRISDVLTATNLYHIAQEACTNALKHAKARKVQVSLGARRGVVTLQVRDDGTGIAANVAAGLGLTIMRSRASVIGAELRIDQNKPHGTIVTCTLRRELPCPANRMNAQLPPARILIVDDHPAIREALSIRIAQADGLEVCGEADDVAEALRVVDATRPDVVIIDVALQTGDGIDLIKRIKKRSGSVRALVWSMYDESIYAERALRAGASGYITKEHATDRIVHAIREVLAGKIYLSPAMSDKLLHRAVGFDAQTVDRPAIETLSDRELEVFRLIGHGAGTTDIASQLHLSVHTVWTYRDRIRDKLELASGAELVRHATRWVLENE
jgi:two-component system CheB/CheR fusion protein